jgi:hypothetical protein
MSCEQGHRLDYLTRRCRVCGLNEETIILKRERRKLKQARPKPSKRRVKGVVG